MAAEVGEAFSLFPAWIPAELKGIIKEYMAPKDKAMAFWAFQDENSAPNSDFTKIRTNIQRTGKFLLLKE